MAPVLRAGKCRDLNVADAATAGRGMKRPLRPVVRTTRRLQTSVRGSGRGKGWRRGMAHGVSCEQSTAELRNMAAGAGVAQYGRKSELYR